MANFLYTNAKRLMLTGAFDWVHDPIVVILIAKDLYAPSINHATLLDVPAEARVATSDVLAGKAVNINVVDADDYMFTYVVGPPVMGVILAVASGNEATSWLICYMDDAIKGIPFNPNAAPVQLKWDDGPAKIFAL